MAALAFGTHMLGSDSQNASFRLHESEIKLLELIRDCVQARVSSDREYSRLLNQSCLKAARYEPVVKTPLAEVWKSVIEKTDALSLKIKDEADHIMNTTCAKLQSLIADRRAAKQLFHEEKNAFENEINKAKAEMNRHYGEYTKAMMKAKQKRVEYDDLNNRGKSSVSKLDDLRRKYSVLTDKLHRIHNDYVLSIREGCAVKDGLVDSLLPMYMSAQQDYCQDSVVQCKSILTEYVRLSDNYNTESSNIHKTMRELVATINPKKEYDEFIKQYQSESKLELPKFDGRIFEGYTGILKPDVITVDDITYEVLDQLKNTYTDRMKNKEADIKAYQAQIKTVKDEIAAVPPTTNKSELTPKRRHLKWLERRLKDMNLFKERQQSILDLISKSLAKADTNNLPKAASLDPDDSTSITSEQNGSAAPVPMPRDGFMSKFTKKFNKKPAQDGATADSHTDSAGGGRGPRPLRDEYCVVVPKEGRPVKMTENPNSPLEDEEWFHGILPREEVVRLLKMDGDYLVRESKKRATNESQYVLSVMWQGPKHFIIQTSENGWRLEGTAHNTIQELIIQQHKSDMPVTNKSQAKLTTPIMRETWQVKNDDIRLEEKIGNGNFGEVFRGYFKGGIVAVKTCKEELQEDQKKKFIGEGRILRRYDHPNIVRFVGIAAQKNPVMIVMEYVSGGALLSWLRKNGIAEPKRSLVQMCIDAGSGMEYLESKNVIHRDLAARNCLISDNKIVKISDFGMSREEETYEVSTGMRQIPIKWTAPEALNYGKYTSACDVWSFGILMWEIFSAGKTPYPGMKNQEARDRVDQGYRMPSPDNCPNAVYALMRDCWEEKPEKRPHFDRIVRELGHAQSEIVR